MTATRKLLLAAAALATLCSPASALTEYETLLNATAMAISYTKNCNTTLPSNITKLITLVANSANKLDLLNASIRIDVARQKVGDVEFCAYAKNTFDTLQTKIQADNAPKSESADALH